MSHLQRDDDPERISPHLYSRESYWNHCDLQPSAMYNSANQGGKLQPAKDYAAENKTNYWDDLVTAEKKNRDRFLGKIGRTTWLSVFAPLGSVGDVIATVDSVCSTLELSDDDLFDLATDLTKLMTAYDRIGIYNFNMSFYSGARHDDHARFHLIISPRIYFNPSIGTPDVASLGRLFGESVCMGFPEEINKALKTEF
jgi:galactose-1-phosphate uridylyltransferase